MTLPASGPISMSQVAAELGISASGLSLNDSRVRALAGKPSGAISLGDLHGKSAASVTSGYNGTSVSHTSVGTASATATYTFNNDGTTNTSGVWYAPTTAGIGSSYWLRATLQSGSSLTAGTTGSWVQIVGGTPTSWTNTTGTGTTELIKSSTLLIEIAASAGGTVLASGTITVSATRPGNV